MEGMDTTLLLERYRSWVVAAAAIAPLPVCAVLAAFRDDVTNASAVLVLVLLVVGAAATGNRLAGVAAAVSGGLCFDFFLTEPYGRLTIDDANDIEATVLLVVIGAAVTEVALWGHRQQARAGRRAGYLDGVLGTAEIVTLMEQPTPALVAHIADQIGQVLEVDGCRFVPGPVNDPRVPVLDHNGHVHRRDHRIDVDRVGLPTDNETALVVRRGDLTFGHFMLTASSRVARPTIDQRKVAVLLADQAASVLVTPRH